MKKSTKKLLMLIIAVISLAICFSVTSFASEAEILDSLIFKANANDDNTAVSVGTSAEGGKYLFLPSSADLESLVLHFDAEYLEISTDSEVIKIESGTAFDLTSFCTEKDGEYTLEFTSGTTLTIMKSANVRALFYVSSDPVNAGRAWVDAVKGNEAEGTMSLVGTDGAVDYTDEVTEIKGRGNSTFTDYSKKPYQIKIKNKTALIEGSSEKSKKWVLLANAADYSLIHNSVTFALADALGMTYTNSYEPVDLYFDGEYRGHYLITEKVEVTSTNVDIDDLDGAIEDANAGTDAYENPVVVTKTTQSKGETAAEADSNGSYKYVEGLAEPELTDGNSHHAYLLELEYSYRYPDEQSGFVTNKGQCIVTKNPEYLTKETGAYIAAFWQEFEDAVYSENGYNTETGKYYYEYCDLESLVNLYLINELAKNYDSFCSSAFFYLPADSDIMYAGPVWDYDICYGIGHRNREIASNPENFFAAKKYLINGLLEIESFREALKETLTPETGKFYLAASSLLGDDGVISAEAEKVSASQEMNYTVWDIYADDYYIYNNEKDNYRIVVNEGAEENYENSVIFFKYFVEKRLDWLSATVTSWNGDNYSIPLDPEPEPEKELSFFERIIAFIMSIIEWFRGLFS